MSDDEVAPQPPQRAPSDASSTAEGLVGALLRLAYLEYEKRNPSPAIVLADRLNGSVVYDDETDRSENHTTTDASSVDTAEALEGAQLCLARYEHDQQHPSPEIVYADELIGSLVGDDETDSDDDDETDSDDDDETDSDDDTDRSENRTTTASRQSYLRTAVTNQNLPTDATADTTPTNQDESPVGESRPAKKSRPSPQN